MVFKLVLLAYVESWRRKPCKLVEYIGVGFLFGIEMAIRPCFLLAMDTVEHLVLWFIYFILELDSAEDEWEIFFQWYEAYDNHFSVTKFMFTTSFRVPKTCT